MGRRPLTVSLTEKVLAGLNEVAGATGVSPEQVAEDALARFVDYERWKSEKIARGIAAANAGDYASDDEIAAVFERYRPVNTPVK